MPSSPESGGSIGPHMPTVSVLPSAMRSFAIVLRSPVDEAMRLLDGGKQPSDGQGVLNRLSSTLSIFPEWKSHVT
jgi:hypothetical protein